MDAAAFSIIIVCCSGLLELARIQPDLAAALAPPAQVVLPSLPATVLPCHEHSFAVLLRQRLTSRVRVPPEHEPQLQCPPCHAAAAEGRRWAAACACESDACGFVGVEGQCEAEDVVL